MRQALRRQLRGLWLGQLIIVFALVIIYLGLRIANGQDQFGNYTLLALLTFLVILLEGSLYWGLKQRQLDKIQSFDPRFVQYTYVVTLLLLLPYPVAVLIALLNNNVDSLLPDAVIGGGIYLFALAGFIHYFLVKLVRSSSDRIALTRRRQVNARLMRELQRYEKRKGIA